MAFSKCTDCVKYKTIIANTKDPVEKSYARAKLATHHQRVTTERQFTELNLAKSRTDEDFFFCNNIESNHVEDLTEEFDRLIEIASQKERYRLLADKEEKLMMSSFFYFLLVRDTRVYEKKTL
jgi:hypothetical protein